MGQFLVDKTLRFDQYSNSGMDISEPPSIGKPEIKYLLQTLYEIPTCSICLQDLNGQLVSLQCGHVFHSECIQSNLGYSDTCPNCKQQIIDEEIRRLHFSSELVQNSKIYTQVMASLSSPGSQIEKLIQQIQQKTKQKEEFKHNLERCQQQRKIIKKVLKNHKDKDNCHLRTMTTRLQILSYKFQSYEQQLNQKTIKFHRQQNELKMMLAKNTGLQSQIEQINRVRHILRTHNKQLLQNDSFLLNKIGKYENELADKNKQIAFLQKEIDGIHNTARLDKKKYQSTRRKFQILSQKARQKGVSQKDIPDIRGPLQTIQCLAEEETLRKPTLKTNGSTTIGGFGCKNKLKNLMKSM